MTGPQKTTARNEENKEGQSPEPAAYANESEEMRLYRWNPTGPPPGTDPTSHPHVIEPLYFPRIRPGAPYTEQREGRQPNEVSYMRRTAIRETYQYLLTIPLHEFSIGNIVYFHRKELQLCSVEDLVNVLGEDRTEWFRAALAPMEGPVAAWKVYRWPKCGKCECYKHTPRKVKTCGKHGGGKGYKAGQKFGETKENKMGKGEVEGDVKGQEAGKVGGSKEPQENGEVQK